MQWAGAAPRARASQKPSRTSTARSARSATSLHHPRRTDEPGTVLSDGRPPATRISAGRRHTHRGTASPSPQTSAGPPAPADDSREKVSHPMNTAKELPPESVPEIRSRRQSMAEHDLRQRVEVSDDGRTVATAEVTASEGSGGTVRVSLHAEPGHITPGCRASLVDAVLDLPEVQESARLEAVLPLGDGESLHRLRSASKTAVPTHLGGACSSMRPFRPAALAARPRPSPRRTPARRIVIGCRLPAAGECPDRWRGIAALPSIGDVDALVIYAAEQDDGRGGGGCRRFMPVRRGSTACG